MSSSSMATTRGCCAASSIAEPANATATAIAATPRDRLLLVVMLAPLLGFPFRGPPIDEARRNISFDCRPKWRRCPSPPPQIAHASGARRVGAFGVVLAHERAAAVFVDMD